MAIQATNVTTAGNIVYTSSGNTVVTFLSLCNYASGNASPVTANIFIVPNNGGSVGTPSNTNIAITSLEIQSGNLAAGGDTYQFYVGNEKLILSNNDTIYANCTANTLTAIVSYTSA